MKTRSGSQLVGDAQAFSLSDLVACVALLSLFGLMLLPAALINAREKAHVVICLNNVKQHGIAQSVLLEEGGVRYENWPRLWIQQLLQARPQMERFCPAAPERSSRLNLGNPAGRLDSPWLVSSAPITNQGSYGMNGYFYVNDPYNVGGMRHFKTPDHVVFPSTTPVFADSVWTDFWPDSGDRPARNLVTADDFTQGGLSRIAIPRHDAKMSPGFRNFDPSNPLPGAVNLVFSDNHAETVKLERLWNFQWHREWVAPAKRAGLP